MGLFEQFPYTNYQQLNIDWVINEIKKLGNDVRNFDSNLQNYVYNYLDKWITDNKIDVAGLISGKVNINAFAPHGDGKTDDKEVFNEAIAFCNQYSVDLELNPTSYYISGPLNNMQNSIYGRGATIIPGIATTPNKYIFNFYDNYEDIVVPATAFTTKSVTDSRLYGKFFHIVSDVDIGERANIGGRKTAEQSVITDRLGNIISANLGFTPVSSCVCKYVREQSVAKVFSDVNYILEKNSNYILGLVDASRDYFTIRNINISGFIISSDYVGAVVSLSFCSNSVIENLHGSGIVSDGSGYILSVGAGTNNTIRNISMGNDFSENWGNIGSSYLTNTTFTNVITNRLDCHYMSFGYFNMEKCTTPSILLPEGGYGNINILNCVFVGKPYTYIRKRTELGLLFAGNIIIDSCIISETGHRLIGYELKDSEIITNNLINAKTNIYIKNCNFDYGIRELMGIIDYDKYELYVYIENCVIRTLANLSIIRNYSPGNTPIYGKFSNCEICGNDCQFLGDTGRENYNFDNCFFDIILTSANGNCNSAITNSHYKKGKNAVRINRLQFSGNVVNADTAGRNISGTQEKFYGNIATDSQYTADWN